MTSRVPWDDGSDRLRTGYDRLKDGISGDFDAVLKTAGIETDAFAIRPLILGHLDELKRTHDDPGSRSRPGFVGSSSASSASPIVIISKNRGGHRCRRLLSSSNRYLSLVAALGSVLLTPATGCHESEPGGEHNRELSP